MSGEPRNVDVTFVLVGCGLENLSDVLCLYFSPVVIWSLAAYQQSVCFLCCQFNSYWYRLFSKLGFKISFLYQSGTGILILKQLCSYLQHSTKCRGSQQGNLPRRLYTGETQIPNLLENTLYTYIPSFVWMHVQCTPTKYCLVFGIFPPITKWIIQDT